MAKQLKPGQLCTIRGHVYRCKKTTIFGTCTECKIINKNNGCLFAYNGDTCFKLFGENYPKLVK